MFNPFAAKKMRVQEVQDLCTLIFNEMKAHDADSSEFAKMNRQYKEAQETLTRIKGQGISADTLLIVGANLLGILLILNFEKINVMSSKATGFLLKPRS
jgi:hypothetical protein